MDFELRKLYHDICQGWTKLKYLNREISIKHLSTFEQVELDIYYEECLETAKQNKIKTRQERLEWLIKNDLWSIKDDISINEQKDYLESLLKTRNKLIFKSQIEQHENLIKEESIKLDNLVYKKESSIGLTAEKVADQKLQFYYIYISFYKNNKIDKLFSLQDLYNLDDEDCNELINFYIKIINKFNILNIKKITLAPYFTNVFYICGDDVKSFFGKPIFQLTNYQASLLSYGMYFKNVISQNMNLPGNIMDDPEKIEEFVNRTRNLNENIEKFGQDKKRVGIMASQEDFQSLNLQQDTSFLNKKEPTKIIDG